MNKYALIREMLGDNISELVAEDLKESYKDLLKELKQTIDDEFKAPMFSYEKSEEIQELKKLLSAFKLVYSYYSVDELHDILEIKHKKQKVIREKKYLVDHRCPICSSPASDKQPQEGLHAYTTVYDCGTEITKAFGSDDEGIYDKRCDNKN
jgi:rubrerythrin